MISTLIDILSWACLLAGGFFYLVGAIGLTRMPDVFTRMHAVSVGDTMGVGLFTAGMVLQAGPSLVTLKLLIIFAVLLFTGSVATHALAKAAFQDKLFPLTADAKGKLVEQDPDTAIEMTALVDTDRPQVNGGATS